MNKLQFFGAIVILHLPIQFIVQGTTSFSVDLIHHDSPLSPFHNKSLPQSDVLKRSVTDSNVRLNHMASRTGLASDLTPPIYPHKNMYLMKLYIGTPPVQFFAIADSGSDLVWVQCSSCNKCFNPSKSLTYQPLLCSSQPCQNFRHYCDNANVCWYDSRYWNGRIYSDGVLSSDTISFDSTSGSLMGFRASVFGCGYGYHGDFFFEGPSSGIVGLGRGPWSLVSQLGPQIDYKFAYCLVHHTSTYASKLRFGRDAFSSGPGVYSTPLVTSNDMNHYPVTLQGISVGQRTTQTPQAEGNIIIDSGTTMTYLPPELYNEVEYFVRLSANLQPVLDPTNMFKLCYLADSISVDQFPSMAFHFAGVDVKLPSKNLFEPYNNMICMTILPSPVGLSIFGCLAQMDMLVGYDLREGRVYFSAADCTKY